MVHCAFSHFSFPSWGRAEGLDKPFITLSGNNRFGSPWGIRTPNPTPIESLLCHCANGLNLFVDVDSELVLGILPRGF